MRGEVDGGGQAAELLCSTVVWAPTDAEAMVSLAGRADGTEAVSVLSVWNEPIAETVLTLLIAGLFETVIELLPAGASTVVVSGGLT